MTNDTYTLTDDQRTMLRGLRARRTAALQNAVQAKLLFEGAQNTAKALADAESAMLACVTGDYTGCARANLETGVVTLEALPDIPAKSAKSAVRAGKN